MLQRRVAKYKFQILDRPIALRSERRSVDCLQRDTSLWRDHGDFVSGAIAESKWQAERLAYGFALWQPEARLQAIRFKEFKKWKSKDVDRNTVESWWLRNGQDQQIDPTLPRLITGGLFPVSFIAWLFRQNFTKRWTWSSQDTMAWRSLKEFRLQFATTHKWQNYANPPSWKTKVNASRTT
jgi:hypothetical protein